MWSDFAPIIFVSLCSILFSCNSPVFAHMDFHEEIDLINQQLKQSPHNKDLLLKRAYLFRLIGHHQDALNEFNHLIKKYPEHAPFYFERALTYKELSDYRQVEADLTRNIQLAGKEPRVLSERAANREKLKQYQQALDDYQSGLQFSQDENFYLRFGKLYQRLGHYQNASNIFVSALKQWPNSIVLVEALLRLEIVRGNYNQAHQLCTDALGKQSFKTPLLLLKAEIYKAAGRKEKAMNTCRQALRECEFRINTGKASAIHRTYRAEVLLAMGDLEEADKEIESVLKKHPDYSRASALKQRIESGNISAKATPDKIFPDQDWTLLHRAAYQAQSDFVRLLIKNGVEVNANDKNGNLPLHIASVRGHTEIVKLLLDAGAAVNVSNKQGRIPLDMAANADIVKILRQTGAKTNKDGTTEQGKNDKSKNGF